MLLVWKNLDSPVKATAQLEIPQLLKGDLEFAIILPTGSQLTRSKFPQLLLLCK